MSSFTLRLARALVLAVLALAVSASAAPAAPSILFALDAHRGTLTPVAPQRGVYDLTLHGVSSPALYFEDRPGDQQGLIRVPDLFRRLFADGQPRPNAVINAVGADGHQALMGVKLSPPHYDVAHHVLRVRVTRLVQGPEAKQVGDRSDVVLPRRFGDTAMFIDNCCGSGAAPVTVFNPSLLAMTVSVNNGPQFAIAGTGAFQSWTPQSAAAGGPTYTPVGAPAPGVLSPGLNEIAATLDGDLSPTVFTVVIPDTYEFDSLQLYLFVSSSGRFSWVLANNGSPVASATG